MSKKHEDLQLEPVQATEVAASEAQPGAEATAVAASEAQPNAEATGIATSEESQMSVQEDIARRTMLEHNLECVYVTSDGTAFYARHDAHNHARNLADDTIFAIEPQKEETNE